MNILLIGHESELNGASKSMLNIINELDTHNNIWVLTSYNNGPFFEELKKHKVTILVYPYYRWCVKKMSSKSWLKKKVIWNLKEKFINISTAKKIAEIVKGNRIQIIHTNTGVVNIGAIISKYSGCKHVWHIREFGDLDFNMYPLVSYKNYYNFMNCYTDRFICISKAIFNHYSNLDSSKKKVIYNGVGEENIIFKSQVDNECVSFLIAGRIEIAKGQDQAIRAAEILYKKGFKNFKLYLAGNGNLNIQIPDIIKDKVILLGSVKNMPALRKNMDIELVCSKAEAFGRVTVEAMLGGNPVIGSNSGGTTELIDDGANGLLYKCGDVEDLADKMFYLASNKEIRVKMGMAAQKYALDHYLAKYCVENIVSLYNELLTE